MKHGAYTGELGQTLTRRIKEEGLPFEIYYDHGDKSQPNVCQPTPYFGDYSNASTLAYVDIVIVDPQSEQLVVLCEIEEEGASPKKVIGDICNLLLADEIRVKGKDDRLDHVNLVLGIKANMSGQAVAKTTAIRDRIGSLATLMADKSLNVHLVLRSTAEELIAGLENEILSKVRHSEMTPRKT